MVKFKHKTLSMPSNIYPAVDGRTYTFYQNIPTEVKEEEDIKYFKNHPDFIQVSMKEIIKEKTKILSKKENIKELIEAIHGINSKEAKILADYYKNFEEFKKIRRIDLIRMTGYSPEKADRIIKRIGE